MGNSEITVIGGGVGGLVAAISAAEGGAAVTLHEAHSTVGGRWRATAGDWIAHEGPHVIYRDGPLYAWLTDRHLIGSDAGVPLRAMTRFWFRSSGRLTRMPPVGLVRMLTARRMKAPVDESFAQWAGRRFGDETARQAASAVGVAVFSADAGALSAAFVWERLRRALALPPTARFRIGSWSKMMPDIADYARSRGVRIETGSRITNLADAGGGPTIVATELESARVLLGDEKVDWPSGRTALLDLGLRARERGSRRDAYIVSDLDDAGWLEDFATPDPSIAPRGATLAQIQLGLRSGEGKGAAITRLEGLADLALPSWRSRLLWRRDAVANRRTGALDPVGMTWRERPAIVRGDGVFLVGDRVAAPGLLSEVSWASGVEAGRAAAERGAERRRNARQG